MNAALVNVPDEYSVLDYDPKDLVQLATRVQKSIRINRDLWNQIDDVNKVALILHEAVYAMIPIEKTEVVYKGVSVWHTYQSSPKAREIVGYLFSEEFKREGRRGFWTIVGTSLPLSLYAREVSPGKLSIGYLKESLDFVVGKEESGRNKYTQWSISNKNRNQDIVRFCSFVNQKGKIHLIGGRDRYRDIKLSFASYSNGIDFQRKLYLGVGGDDVLDREFVNLFNADYSHVNSFSGLENCKNYLENEVFKLFFPDYMPALYE